jgi:putative ABC transport system permease protein
MAIPLSYNLRNIRSRWRVMLLAIVGIALVVAVFIVLVALHSGLRIALRATGRAENAIVVQRGSQSELTSGIGRDDAEFMSVDGRVARDANGSPLASPEIVVMATLPRKVDATDTNIQVRGVTAAAFRVRGGIEIVAGRTFTPGLTELIVGERLTDRVRQAAPGSTIKLKGREWTVVGVFRAAGGSFESELWGDLDVLASTFNRVGGYQSVTLRMADSAQIPALADDFGRNPRLQVTVKPEPQYYEEQAGPVGAALLALAVFVAVVMGVGAVFGAMNTMYAVVVQRTREVGTLRALGFSRFSILVSFVLESIAISLVAGVLGVLLALPADGITTATGNVTFSELAFAFQITPQAIAAGMVFAALMGLFGGLLPAVRAARMSILQALREA